MKLDVISTLETARREPWYARDGLKFTCTQCGNCCTGGPGYVWISDVEVDRLADFLKLSRDETITRHCRRIGSRISLREHRNLGLYDCEFLREVPAERVVEGQTVQYSKRICTIYPVRPLQCRTWPFWKENLTTPDAWKHAGRKCPGMNAGNSWDIKQIEQIRNATDWLDSNSSPEKSPNRKHTLK